MDVTSTRTIQKHFVHLAEHTRKKINKIEKEHN